MTGKKLGDLLRTYRIANGVGQAALGRLLGVSQSYISKIESGERDVRDADFLRKISERLVLSPSVLGIDHLRETEVAMRFIDAGEASVRLAEEVRLTGRSGIAVRELQPLVWHLEAMSAKDNTNKAVRLALGRANAVLGTALGDVMPDLQTGVAADRLYIAHNLLENNVSTTELVSVRIKLGNELRKMGRLAESSLVLEKALAEASTPNQKGAAAICLARLNCIQANRRDFDRATRMIRVSLDRSERLTPTFNPYAFEEVALRGGLRFGTLSTRGLSDAFETPTVGLAPQWTVIRSITIADGLLTIGERDQAIRLGERALQGADFCALPQQILRLLKIIEKPLRDSELIAGCHTSIARLAAQAHLFGE